MADIADLLAHLTAVQTLMLVLAFTGLATGLLVTEHRRTELQLRLQQEEHARIARLGTLGELATNIAHEINQPLMAAGTYSRLVARNLDAQAGNLNAAQDATAKTVAQIERAADVVRSLRALVRLGRSDTAPVSAARLVSAAVELVRPLLASGQIILRQEIPTDLPMVMVDALQIEQVLINLMRNSIEAMSGSPAQRGAIVVSAARRRLPGLTGLELQRELATAGDLRPLILITGHGDIQMAVEAIKAGAHDFIEKPFDETRLKHQILCAVAEHRRGSVERAEIDVIRSRISELSQRQLQVMQLAVRGATNKEIAAELGISPRTVEDYRAWVMRRLDARNLAELVRLVTWVEAKAGNH